MNTASRIRSKRILLVEHEPRLRECICAGLGLDRDACETVTDAAAALRHTDANAFDLIVVDLGAPHVGRLQLCQTVRLQPLNRHAPIVIIASSEMLAEAQAEMEHGADDFIVRPFRPGELAARARAAMHRSRSMRARENGTAVPAPAAPAVRHGDIQVDPARRHVRIKDRRVTLTEQEFHLLYLLARHAGVVFSRDGLLSQVWGSNRFVTVRSVDTLVSRLRRRIEPDHGDHPRYVLTVRGVGYKLGDSCEA